MGLDGVKKADISFSEKEAVVYYEEGKTSVEEMVRAVGRAGFRASEQQGP